MAADKKASADQPSPKAVAGVESRKGKGGVVFISKFMAPLPRSVLISDKNKKTRQHDVSTGLYLRCNLSWLSLLFKEKFQPVLIEGTVFYIRWTGTQQVTV